MGAPDLAGTPTPSCRLDWLSVSYFAATASLQREQLAYFLHVAEIVCPGADWRPGAGRRFFTEALTNEDAGITLRWTEPNGGLNSGGLSVDLSGRFFKYVTPEERAALYLDAAELEGFRQCTRFDAQRTVIDPIADAEQIHAQVRDRMIWLPGYSGYSQLGPVDSKGDAVKGASVVWGSPRSAIRNTTYNKALEDKWPDCRAVRHESRRRKQPARDGFAKLVDMIRSLVSGNPGEAEIQFTQSVLASSMNYRDTSRFAHIADKRQWPDNWAKDCPPADFMAEVIEGTPVEIKTTWRITKALEDSIAAMNRQYGRKEALWVLWQCYAQAKAPEEAMLELLDQAVVRLKDEDLDELLKLVPAEQHERLVAEWPQWRSVAAHNVEGTTRQTYGFGTHVQ